MDDTVKTLLITAVGGVAAYLAYEYVLAPMIAGAGTTGATTDPTAAPDGSSASDPQGVDAAMYGDAASYSGVSPQQYSSYPVRNGGRPLHGYVNPEGQWVRFPQRGTVAYREFMNTHYSARVAAGLQKPAGPTGPVGAGYWGHQVNNGWDTIHPIYAGGGGSPAMGLQGLGMTAWQRRMRRQRMGQQGYGAPIDGGQNYWDQSAEEISGPNSLAQLAVMDEGSFSN